MLSQRLALKNVQKGLVSLSIKALLMILVTNSYLSCLIPWLTLALYYFNLAHLVSLCFPVLFLAFLKRILLPVEPFQITGNPWGIIPSGSALVWNVFVQWTGQFVLKSCPFLLYRRGMVQLVVLLTEDVNLCAQIKDIVFPGAVTDQLCERKCLVVGGHP